MAIMEVIIKGRSQGQLRVHNLNFFAEYTGIAPARYSDAVAQMLGVDTGGGSPPVSDSILYDLMSLKCVTESLTELFIRDVYNENDLLTIPLTNAEYTGLQGTAGALQQNFVVSKIKSNRTQTGIRPGTLSCGRVPDSQVADDGALTGTWVTLLQTFCDALNAPPNFVDGTTTFSMSSIIVAKERYAIEHLPPKPDTFAYKYYATEAVQLTHIMYGVEWSPYVTVRSLVSATPGKGA